MKLETNKRFIKIGIMVLISIPIMILAGIFFSYLGFNEATVSKVIFYMFGIALFCAFTFIIFLGLFPRAVTFYSKNPIYSSKLDNVSQNSSTNQKREREVLSTFKSVGLSIDELSEQK